MTAIAALRCPLDEDLSDLLALLRQSGVPHRVTEERGQQVLWVPDQRFAELVQSWHHRIPQEVEPQPQTVRHEPLLRRGALLSALRQQPVTLILLLLSLLVGVVSGLGDNLQVVGLFTMTELQEIGGQLWMRSLLDTLQDGQLWRLITPIFLHFGVLHLAMNSLWLWELGRRIEWRQHSWMLLLLTLLFALVSNLAQSLLGGPAIFGGLSGVIYGLLGHCWLFNRLAPTSLYHLPTGVVVMMIGWLLLCMTGFTEVVGLGAIANAAHVGGLLAGCITGVLGGLLARQAVGRR